MKKEATITFLVLALIIAGVYLLAKSKIEGKSIIGYALYNLQENSSFKIIAGFVFAFLLLLSIAFYAAKFIWIQGLFISSGTMRTPEALEALLFEFELAKSKKDIDRARRISSRIKHLYQYIPDNKKIFFKARINEMERYIN